MVSTKELRGIFDDMKSEATKRAAHAVSESSIGRRRGPPGLLILGVGLVLGAVIGMVAAIFASPYSGEQARARISARMERMRTQHEMAETNGANGSPVATPVGGHERQGD